MVCDGNNAAKKGMWLVSFEEGKELRKCSYERDPVMDQKLRHEIPSGPKPVAMPAELSGLQQLKDRVPCPLCLLMRQEDVLKEQNYNIPIGLGQAQRNIRDK